MTMRRRVRISRRRPVEEAEIVVIPMIDVMMFLLFFFMVSSLALVVQSGLPVNLPKASTADTHRSDNVTITIMPGATPAVARIYVNTKETPLNQVRAGLEAMHVTPQNLVIINADQHVEHGAVVSCMDEARKAGITRFAIATDKG